MDQTQVLQLRNVVNIDPMYPGGSVKEDVANLPEQDRQVCRTEKIKLVVRQ
jgi:hypothetical protein